MKFYFIVKFKTQSRNKGHILTGNIPTQGHLLCLGKLQRKDAPKEVLLYIQLGINRDFYLRVATECFEILQLCTKSS